MPAFRQVEKFLIADSTTATFTLRNMSLAILGLTIWAVSGERPLTDMTFQPQLNGEDFGSSTNVLAAVASDVVYAGGVDEDVLPEDAGSATVDPFVFSVLVTNSSGGPTEDVTLYAVGLTGGH